ncbi:hypothetical protein [Stanieria cyanosphaera]|uniref:hypothetical protein n=1 Tax=Stanieria cyanosphaera TaxID=102116 RepID=UPI00030CCE43|nr:hypothetical protein [Stanieria cyanosphaera]
MINRLILIIVVFLIINFWQFTLPVEAAFCRNLNNHNICILQIKRSAKYYWEYRATISIDGKKKPREIYNCRTHYVIKANRQIIPFESNGIGQLICSKFAKTN